MASSSGNSLTTCENENCKKAITVPRPGWKRLGRSVSLCNECYIAYMTKNYCYIHHKDSTLWSFCKYCNKRIHRPCLVTQDWYTSLGDREIKCNDCEQPNAISQQSSQETGHIPISTSSPLAPVQQTSETNNQLPGQDYIHDASRSTPQTLAPESSGSKSSTKGRAQVEDRNEKPGTGTSGNNELDRKRLKGKGTLLVEKTFSGKDTGKSRRLVLPKKCAELPRSRENVQESIRTPTPLAVVQPTLVASNQVTDEPQSTPPPLALEPSGSKSSTKAQAQVQASNEKPSTGTSRNNERERYTPKMTVEELDEIFKGLNEKVTPLFEKTLSATDTGKGGRLVLPKKCAEKFFPTIDDAEGERVVVQDSNGKDWRFSFRMWPNSNSRIYFLEGFEPYVRSMKLAEGDTVTFCKLEPEGKLVIGYRKVPSPTSKVNLLPKPNTTSRSNDKGKMVMGSTTSKEVSKEKTTSTKRKSNIQSDLDADFGVLLKKKSCQIGSTSKTTKNRNKTHEDLPCGSNAPSVVVEKGFERSTSKVMTRSATHSTASKRQPNDLASAHETDMEHAVTLLVPTKWNKKHRSGCICVVCKAARESNHQSSSQAPVVSMSPEIQSSNTDAQTTHGGGSEENRIADSVLGSDSKGLAFDLNDKLPEPDEELN